MPDRPTIDKLRDRIRSLEDSRHGFSRIIPIADTVDRWLPHGGLPGGCIHEVKGSSLATALAFSAIVSARLAGEDGNIVYIAPDHSLHPPGLGPYGIRLSQLLLVSVRRRQDLAWAVMEALRCPQVSAVMSIFEGADLTTSRRLQLAAESSGATGFFIGSAHSAPVAAPITRWKISSNNRKRVQRFDEPTWILDLLYCRGGRPGQWAVEWRNPELTPSSAIPQVEQAAQEPAQARDPRPQPESELAQICIAGRRRPLCGRVPQKRKGRCSAPPYSEGTFQSGGADATRFARVPQEALAG